MDWRRWTGVVGFVWVLIQVAAVALFLIAGSPPEFGDAKKFTAWINTNSGLLMDDAFLTGVATLPYSRSSRDCVQSSGTRVKVGSGPPLYSLGPAQ